MALFTTIFLVALAGYAFGEAVGPEPLFSRPYPLYNPSAPDAEDAPQFRLNNNYLFNGLRLPEGAPTTNFQMCSSTNNLNRASGVVQLLPGAAPRRCFFVIKAPDSSKSIELHCSRVAVGLGATLSVVASDDTSTELKEGVANILPYDVYTIKYEDTINSGSFTCDWRQVAVPVE